MRLRDRVLAPVALVALTAFVYRRAASAYFFDDDFQWLVGTWTFHPSQLFDFGQINHFYRPVIDLYFAAATPLFNGSPALFHLANIALHAANAVLLLTLARAMSGRADYAFLTALFFVVQPADIDAIAWVSALAEPIGAFFGCTAILAFLRFRGGGGAAWRVLSALAFAVALLTHESSVVFLPLIALADWAFIDGSPTDAGTQGNWSSTLRALVPYGVLAAVYLAIDLQINSRNYVVTQGYYRIGGHVVGNALDYLSALYVGRGNIANYLLIAVGVVLLFLKGSRRIVFATSWLVLALLPFVFFRWSNTSRYVYLPAMGFSMLVADGVLQIDRLLAARLSRTWRTALVALLAIAIAGRFLIFAVRNVRAFADRSEEYRRYIALFRDIHGDLPSHSIVPPDARLRTKHEHGFITALVQWEYRDQSIQLAPDEPNPR